MSYRRVDPSDPRKAELIKPFALPKSWDEPSIDVYGSLLGSASMMAGASMLTKLPQLAYVGLLMACAHFVHQKPLRVSTKPESSTTGPWASLAFSLFSIAMLALPKLTGFDALGGRKISPRIKGEAGV